MQSGKKFEKLFVMYLYYYAFSHPLLIDKAIFAHLHIPPDGDAGFAFFRGAFFAVVFEFSVAADGDDGVFF